MMITLNFLDTDRDYLPTYYIWLLDTRWCCVSVMEPDATFIDTLEVFTVTHSVWPSYLLKVPVMILWKWYICYDTFIIQVTITVVIWCWYILFIVDGSPLYSTYYWLRILFCSDCYIDKYIDGRYSMPGSRTIPGDDDIQITLIHYTYDILLIWYYDASSTIELIQYYNYMIQMMTVFYSVISVLWKYWCRW